MLGAWWGAYLIQLLAAEISRISRYYDQTIQVARGPSDRGDLLHQVRCSTKSEVPSFESLPDLSTEKSARTIVLLNGTLNFDLDIQDTLTVLKDKLSRTSRVVLVAFNPYLRWIYQVAQLFGLWRGAQSVTFVTRTDLTNLAKLSGYEVVRITPVLYCPFRLLGIGDVINALIRVVPYVRWIAPSAVIVLRPIVAETSSPSLTIIIPARNEKGNIEPALQRLSGCGFTDMEVLFVEGNSTDGTWEEIQRVVPLYSHLFAVQSLKQPGKGKSDAVRLGFTKATKDLVTILDADLTMPPELLGRFCSAYSSGVADFINGNRLVYPAESSAMRFLNRIGNVFFAKSISVTLGTRIGDSLCGTKLFARHDYERFVQWRNDFGDFDPFGDFELIFPASELALGVVDIPIRYRNRTYGQTNIRRFYHGWMLFKMTLIGFWKITLGFGR